MFRDYIVGRIPDDWTIDGIAGLLSEEFSGTWGPENANGVSVLRSTNFQNNGYLNLDSVAVREIPENHLSNKAINIGDILLERSGGGPQQPVGRVSWCDDRVTGWTFSNFCQILRPSAGVDSKFLFYALYYLHMSSITLTYQNQTTGIRNLEYKSYLRISIPLPPLPEQRKITEILSTVDKTIEKTDAIIQETQQLKKGLMQKLFTEGIGHTQFKTTRIGQIPEEWEVMRVRDIATLSTSGVAYEDYEKGKVSEGTKVIYLKVSDLNLQGNEKRIKSGMIEGFFNDGFMRNAHVIQPPSLIFPKRGAAISTNKKRIAGVHVVLDPNLMALTTGEKAPAKVAYLYYYFLTVDLSQIQDSGTVPQLNKRNIEPLLVPVPSSQEQFRIVEILSEVDAKIETEQAFKAELEQLKRGLMQVLLTGKVRVKV